MSVIISDDKLIVHSYNVPVVFDSIQEPGVRYLIADGKWTPIPNHLGYKHIVHFRKEFKGARHEAFKTNYETEVEGSKGKKYTVKCIDDTWSCTCPAFGFSGSSGCKHIIQVKKDNNFK